MSIKIVLDAGHGFNTAGKRTPDGEREWSFNNVVLLAAQSKLLSYKGVKVLRTDDPSGKTDIPLRARTNKANAWKPDVLVSIHHNANAGRWGAHGGVETFVQNGAMKASFAIAETLQTRIVKAMGLRDRGVKSSNLHMTRETIGYPAILTEGGFMDSTTDIGALRSDAKLKAQGIAIAEGLASYYGLKLKGKVEQVSKPKPSTPDKPAKKPFEPKTSTSIVDWLNANELDSSMGARKKLAEAHGIVNYKGTEAQNIALLKAVQGGVITKSPSKPAESLAVDGYLGKATISALQRYFGTPVDGVISRPSTVIRALQRLLDVTADGYFGPNTIKALQRRFGTYADGEISRPSPVIKELQRRLNNGKL